MITVKKDAIKFRNSEGNMQSAGVLCEVGVVGGGEDLLQYATGFGYMFYKQTFPSDYVLTLNIELDEVADVNNIFNRTFADTTLAKIILNGYVNGQISFGNTFQSTTAKEVDLSNFKCSIKGMSIAFNRADQLETIRGEFDLSECTNLNTTFSYAYNLKDISFKPNTIPLSIAFPHSSKLSDASIQSIIDGLATVETAQTLTFTATVKAKLTEEQIATITSKNWTLA